MRRSWLWLLVAWGVTGGSATAAETWLEVKTASFTVVSNAGEKAARRTAREFEQVQAAYRKVWPWARISSGRPTLILAFKNKNTLRRWAPGYFEVKGGIDVVSGTAHGPDRQFLLLRTDSRPRDIEVTPNYNLYRAYVRLLLSNSFERRLPFWLASGLREVLGNTFVRDDEILLGRPMPRRFRHFSENARLPLASVLDARPDSPLADKDDWRQQFDAHTYVLVHYLLFGDEGAHSAKLARFQQLWLAGRSQDQALAEAFGDLSALEGALPVYARSRLIGYARLKAETHADAGQLQRILSPAEVAGLQAALHVAMDRPVEAQTAIRESRTADERSPVSYDAEGLLADRDRDEVRATQAYAQAVALGSTNAYSHCRAAQLAWKPQLDEPARLAIRKHLERAIELNPSYANALSFLAEVLADGGEAEAAFALVQRAVALEPGQSYHRVALARVLLKLNRNEDARKLAELGLQLADNDADRSNAERFLLYLKQVVQYDDERAKHEAANACQDGDASACTRILPDLERSCAAKDVGACRFLNWLYSQGGGVPADGAKAAAYLQQACDAGDKKSCVEHAWALARGEGMAKNEPKAIASLEALCNADFLPACTRLALIHVANPSARHQARAKALLTRACEGGQQDACTFVQQLK